ncbi:MAG: GIY-YIG nuclease family protein [Silvanigrellales bacterium]|nr:GIY-YIG nuclease family protein [Silvanigrellales bacterium]
MLHIPSKGTWCVYLLRLNDGSLYCGCSNDVVKRLQAHRDGRGSRLVRARLPAEFAYIEIVREGGRSAAQAREAEVKKYEKSRKETLCETWTSSHRELLTNEQREHM